MQDGGGFTDPPFFHFASYLLSHMNVSEYYEHALAERLGDLARRDLAPRHGAQFEIDAVEELTLVRIGRHEKSSQLEAIGQELPILHSERQIKAKLPPIRQAVSEFRRTVEAAIRPEASRKRRQGLTARDIVEVLLNGPLAYRGNRRVVDLNLIGRVGNSAGEAERGHCTNQHMIDNAPDSRRDQTTHLIRPAASFMALSKLE